eukprot:3843531-Alexandrium_andersonii.AAC.1
MRPRAARCNSASALSLLSVFRRDVAASGLPVASRGPSCSSARSWPSGSARTASSVPLFRHE